MKRYNRDFEVSEEIRELLRKRRPTDLLAFYDEDWRNKPDDSSKRIMVIGGSYVDLKYFSENLPNGLVKKNMVIEPTVDKFETSNATLAGMILDHYKMGRDYGDQFIGFFVCSRFNPDKIKSTIKNMGVDVSEMPPIMTVKGKKHLIDGRVYFSPHEYDYKQTVGWYAKTLPWNEVKSTVNTSKL